MAGTFTQLLSDQQARAVAAGDKGTYARSEEQLDLAKARVTDKQAVLLHPTRG